MNKDQAEKEIRRLVGEMEIARNARDTKLMDEIEKKIQKLKKITGHRHIIGGSPPIKS